MSGPIDRHDVDQLVVQHLPAALGLAQRLTGDRDLAEDLVQEALCRVLDRWRSFRGEASFRTWMLQIVVNVDRDRRRRHRDKRPVPDEIPTKAESAIERLAANELGETIRAAIDELPERQREVALLVFGEGLTANEAAYVLGITDANVHTCIHLARKRIADVIGVNLARRK
jgi:RNA polymerase sigma-70 factor (ECF subfamily)